jgi:hypothetical protein
MPLDSMGACPLDVECVEWQPSVSKLFVSNEMCYNIIILLTLLSKQIWLVVAR